MIFRTFRRLGHLGLAAMTCTLAFACHSKSDTPSATPSAKAVIPSAAASSSSAPALASASATPTSSAPASSGSGDAARPTLAKAGLGPLLIDAAVDVAPSGPLSASESGLVLIDKEAHVAFAKRGELPSASTPAKAEFSALDRPKDDFIFGARGPAVVAGFAYWAKEGTLVRARIAGARAEPEVLAKDARKGARVVGVETPDQNPLIGYISTPDSSGAPHAKLWSAGKVYELTPEGAGASSMALVPVPNGWLAITLDGRSGMTPLHARHVTREKNGALSVGPDVVVWVGASAQSTTEVFATETDGDVWAFVPIEQDLTHFGLAQIHIGAEPHLDAPVHFLTYANGTNSAPVAATNLCGRGAVVFAEPESADPKANQRLMLATLGRDGLEAPEVVASGGSYAHLSLAAVPLGPASPPGALGSSVAGGLLAYTANHRSWARSLRCRPPGAVRAALPGGSEKR